MGFSCNLLPSRNGFTRSEHDAPCTMNSLATVKRYVDPKHRQEFVAEGPENEHRLGGGRLVGGMGLCPTGLAVCRERAVYGRCLGSNDPLGRLAAPMVVTPMLLLWGAGVVVVGAPPLLPKAHNGPQPRVRASRFARAFYVAARRGSN